MPNAIEGKCKCGRYGFCEAGKLGYVWGFYFEHRGETQFCASPNRIQCCNVCRYAFGDDGIARRTMVVPEEPMKVWICEVFGVIEVLTDDGTGCPAQGFEGPFMLIPEEADDDSD